MKSKISWLAVIILLLWPAVSGAASFDLQEGLWEITITMDFPGMPDAGQPMIHKQCITLEDKKDTKNILPSSSEDCKVLDYQVTGNRVSWKVQCDAGTGTGEMIFRNNAYEGTMKMVMAGEEGSQQATMHYKGRRIGDCQ